MPVLPVVFTFFCLTLEIASALNDLGTITGTVTDSAGALMPGIRIEVKNIDTGDLRQVSSTSAGSYTVSQLPAGDYQIAASVRGFRPYLRSGIPIAGGQTIRIDIALMMLSSDEVLTNDSIIKLVKVGINEDVIVSKVRESQCNFDLSVDGLVALKENGVSDRLIAVLMNPSKAAEAKAPMPPARAPDAAARAAAPKELPKAPPAPRTPAAVGIYIKKSDQWTDIQPEIVTYHTSGAFARLATAGIVQNDVNGRISGAHSSNDLKMPAEFLIVPMPGVAITEYQLIHLQQQRNAREFLSVIGGIFSSSGGATRDLLKYESTKTPEGAYSIRLQGLSAGEYGFLLAGADASSTKAGKIYTFRVTE